MMTNSTTNLIANRYELLEVIGQGGMGVVYRSLDHLTQDFVALKKMIRPAKSFDEQTDQLGTTIAALGESETIDFSLADTKEVMASTVDVGELDFASTLGRLRLTITREFQTLARLRHPHIISVLDYGFDTSQQPFFTMQLLEKPKNLVEAAIDLSVPERVELIMQVLEALSYLHRCGIIHRDIKPDNALVTVEQEVKVLDFGLSRLREHHSTSGDKSISGTIRYMAPEVLQGNFPSESADLFAVGLMAYEVFAGYYPFNTDNIGTLVNGIVFQEPDTDALDINEDLRNILDDLLTKEAQNRPANIDTLLERFNAAIDNTITVERINIRESYLQAAPFTGRVQELATLTDAVQQTLKSQGSSWLIGGEAGVGKSRLLDELRIRGLVNGMTVVMGHSLQESGMSYQLWREPLKRLSLMAEMSTVEANILKTLMSDVETVLQRDIPDVVQNEFSAYADQLSSTILSLFQRQNLPILLLLDDLQWEDEGLEILNSLSNIVSNRPLMIVATYRSEEKPELPSQLATMTYLKLEKLSDEEVTHLSTSMIGEVAKREDVHQLLMEESQGNVFFLIDVIRALAEQAGRLRHIGYMPLPENLLVGGLQSILEHRLSLVAEDDMEILQMMALIGQEIDMTVLEYITLHEDIDIEEWLAGLSNIAVLERFTEIWRFSHDRLREATIKDLSERQNRQLSEKIAITMENVYPNTPEKAGIIANHWQNAENTEKEKHYLPIAGDYALRINTFDEAAVYFQRALDLIQGNQALQAELELKLAEALQHTGDYSLAQSSAEHALELLNQDEDTLQHASALKLLADIYWQQSKFDEAESHIHKSLQIARQNEDSKLIVRALSRIGMLAQERGKYDEARDAYMEGLQLAEAIDDEVGKATLSNNYGILAYIGGDYAQARSFFEASLAVCEIRGEQHRANAILNNLGSVAGMQGDLDAAVTYFHKSLNIARTIGDRRSAAFALENLGYVSQLQSDFFQAKNYIEEGLELAQAIGNQRGVINALIKLSLALYGLGLTDEAKEKLLNALRQANEIQALASLTEALTHLAKFSENIAEVLLWLGIVLNHSATTNETKQIANNLVDTWKKRTSDIEVEQYLQRAWDANVEEVVNQILNQ